MKNNNNLIYILIALIVLQVYSYLKINILQREVENTTLKISYMESRMEDQINSIYQNVDAKLMEQNSIIKTAAFDIGNVDANSLEVPVTFSVIPKEVSAATKVFLDFNGDIISLEKEGNTYTGIKNVDIFAEVFPTVIVETNGVKQLEDNRGLRLGNITEQIFPVASFPRFSGSTSYSGSMYKINGDIDLDFKLMNKDFYFKELNYVVKINDTEYLSKEMDKNNDSSFSLKLEEKIPLEKGEILTTYVVATDNLGLIHEYHLEHYAAGEKAQREPYREKKRIYSSDMELIYERNY